MSGPHARRAPSSRQRAAVPLVLPLTASTTGLRQTDQAPLWPPQSRITTWGRLERRRRHSRAKQPITLWRLCHAYFSLRQGVLRQRNPFRPSCHCSPLLFPVPGLPREQPALSSRLCVFCSRARCSQRAFTFFWRPPIHLSPLSNSLWCHFVAVQVPLLGPCVVICAAPAWRAPFTSYSVCFDLFLLRTDSPFPSRSLSDRSLSPYPIFPLRTL